MPNIDYPSNKAVVDAMQDTASRMCDGVDCSEIAEQLFYVAGEKGYVVVFRNGNSIWPSPLSENIMPKFSPPFNDAYEFNYPTKEWNGNIGSVTESYHAVYSDGRYIYDGALHTDGIPISDYMKLVNALNDTRVSYRLYNPNDGGLFKGTP
ncbi:hypothetical protein [uncultured Shewanella sp.]|uniref:hypothetical protein n=1 Tax=uncultured Shewanella sp. TaxID=173975 RepID=UPI0026021DE8|nr:hypothetical protein [uncultured Shewanella sp.]